MNQSLKKISNFLINALIFIAYVAISQIAFTLLGIYLGLFKKVNLTSGIIFIILGMVNVWGMLVLAKKNDVFQFKKDFLTTSWKNIVIPIIGLFSMLAINKIIAMLLLPANTGVDSTANQQALISILTQTWTPTFFISTVIIAPIMEEIIFRGLIMNRFLKDKPILGLIVSTGLFGLAHGPDSLYALCTYCSMGLILGLVYYFTKRLECSMMVHIFNNLLAVVYMIIMT